MAEFKVTHYKIRIPDEANRPSSPFSLVLLSDLHNMCYGPKNAELLQEIRNQEPEAVLAAGDLVTATAQPRMHAAEELLDELTKRYPVYYVNGNHEQRMRWYPQRYGDAYARYTETIRSFGVHLLENESEKLRIRRMKLAVWGLELGQEHYGRFKGRELTAGEIERELGRPQEGFYHILLVHHPACFEAYAAWGADLSLAGHYHGGIVRVPGLGGAISPQLELFPRYSRGMFEKDGKRMIVSAGLGSHTLNLRINNPPELVVIDFL